MRSESFTYKSYNIIQIMPSNGFRRTFCTRLLRSGLDARSVMQLMGHSDIESTMRYWRPLEVEELRAKVDAVFA